MANEKIINLENLKVFRQKNDKRYENGKVEVGIAKQLKNVSEESGTTQDMPFNFQATGTDGFTSSADTAPIAKHLKLKGNTVIWNQLVTNGNFTNTNNWSATNGSFSVNSNIATFTATAQNGYLSHYVQYVQSHKYLIMASVKLTTATTDVFLRTAGYDLQATSSTTDWQILSGILNGYDGDSLLQIIDKRESGWDDIQIKDVMVFDLNKLGLDSLADFEYTGTNNTTITIDKLAVFKSLYPLPYYEYDSGTLKSCKVNKLINIGYNAFDGEMEQGGINSDGTLQDGSNSIRSKNYTKVVSGFEYKFDWEDITFDNGIYLCEYDGNKTFIKRNWLTSSSSTPQNAKQTLTSRTQYIKFVISVSSGTLSPSGHKICFHLLWDGSRTGYEDYEKHEYSLPNIELRSVGSVSDEILPDGTYTQIIGTGILGNAYSSQRVSANGVIQINVSSWGIKANSNYGAICNLLCATYQTTSFTNSYNATNKNSIGFVNDTIAIQNDDFIGKTTEQIKTMLNNVIIYFERNEPVITTVSSFTENVIVDDFGTMEFVSTLLEPIIPQGNEFFYPADYVLLIDSLSEYVDGDVSKLAKKSDLDSIDLNDYPKKNVDETITGKWTFKGTPVTKQITFVNNVDNPTGISFNIQNDNGYNTKLSFGGNGLMFTTSGVFPIKNELQDFGSTSYKWKNLYLSGSISDGTNSLSVADISNSLFNVINASDIVNNTLTADQLAIFTNEKPTLIIGSFLNTNNAIITCIKENSVYGYKGILTSSEYIGIFEIDTSNKCYLRESYNASGISLGRISQLNGKSINYYRNNVYPYATNSTTQLEYETINEISISADTTFTFATAPSGTYPEYKAYITNDSASSITLTFTGVSKTWERNTNQVHSQSTISIGAGETIELVVQNGKASYLNWGN